MNNELKKYIETVPAVADFVTEKDKRGKNTEDPGCGEGGPDPFLRSGKRKTA